MGLSPWEPVGARIAVWAMNSDQRRTIEGWCRKFPVRTVEKVRMREIGLYPDATGVFANGGRFASRITVKRKKVNLGTYATWEEAHEAYLDAKQKYFGWTP